MNWFIFCYWFEPDAPDDPVGLVRIWTLADALTSAGDRVTLFPPRYRSARVARASTIVPIRVWHFPLLRPLSYALLSMLQAVRRAFVARPDIVYYRWMDSPHALLLAKLMGARCVCEVNGEPVPEWSSGAAPSRAIRQWLARVSLRACDGVVVLTEGLRDLLVRRYGVPSERIVVLPSGTDTQLFAPRDPAACRSELGLPADVPYIGFVGSFYRYQGLACLLEAMVTIKVACPKARLLLVGDGEAAAELKEQAARSGLTDSIIWTGRVPYRQVPLYIGAMTVCVAPFRGDRGETSPVKVFDYLACARPVVASAIPSVEAVFSSGNGVHPVTPDDPERLTEALLSLLHDPGRREAMGAQGRRFVEHRFSWTSIIDRLRGWLRPTEVTPHHAHSRVL